jgi:hypothetical protein
VQVETNVPASTTLTGNVLLVTLPASTNTLLWAGTASFSQTTTQAVYLVDFGRHDSGTNGLSTSSPDANGNYWNNMGSIEEPVPQRHRKSPTWSAPRMDASTIGFPWSPAVGGPTVILNGGLFQPYGPTNTCSGNSRSTNATMDYFFTTSSDVVQAHGPEHGQYLQIHLLRFAIRHGGTRLVLRDQRNVGHASTTSGPLSGSSAAG